MNFDIRLNGKTFSLHMLSILLLSISLFPQGTLKGEIRIRRETVSFFDGSSLAGELLEVNKTHDLRWNHKSSLNPLQFDYKAVDSIMFDRVKVGHSIAEKFQMRVLLKNKDFLRGTLKSLDDQNLVFASDFGKQIKVEVSNLASIEFLPESYKVIYSSTKDFKNWKKSNSKAWSEERGNLVSVFSGSTGITLPKVDALEVNFEAQWERSFYLALRFFSDSNGNSYGSEGYHLSFSNNRINLQSNRKVDGRTIRETLGSVLLDELVGVKKADFQVSAHRKKKEFIVHLNGKEVAHWKDSTTDFTPTNHGFLLINQGGNSYLRLNQLSIAGWQGDYFKSSMPSTKSYPDLQFISFKNGDSTDVLESRSTENGLSIKTNRGTYEVPLKNIHLLTFPSVEDINKTKNQTQFSEQVILNESFGKLSFNIHSIRKNLLHGNHIYLGNFSLPLHRIKLLRCNLVMKLLEEYLKLIKSAEYELKSQNSEKALEFLKQTNPSFRCWYWTRLKFLAQDSQPKEILWFNPHPDAGISNSFLYGKKEHLIFTNGKDGTYRLWKEDVKLVEGNFTDPKSANEEIGRLRNEKWKKIYISKDFWLGKTEISQDQFEKIMGENPSKRKGANLPAQVNWFEAKKYCEKLNKKIITPPGFIWRLPTEAEWEYASRAGSTGPFCDTFYGKFKNDETTYLEHLSKYGWHSGNSDGQIHPIGMKSANAWGLHDMHGNVWEWCADATSIDKKGLFTFPRFGSYDPWNLNGEWKILKGGSFATEHTRCRSAYRGANSPTTSSGDRGFRICLAPDLSKRNEALDDEPMNNNEDLNTIIKISQIPMAFIPKGSFMMGSRSESNRPKAILHEKSKLIVFGNNLGEVGITSLSAKPTTMQVSLNQSIIEIKVLKDKPQALVGTEDGSVHLINLLTKKIDKKFTDHDAPISSIAIDPQETGFISCDVAGKLVFRNFDKQNPEWILTNQDYSGDIEHIEFSNDSKNILCSSLNSDVQILARTGDIPKVIFDKSRGDLIIAKWLPNRNYISILHPDGILSLVEPKSGFIYKLVRLNLPSASDINFTEDGKKMLLTTEKGSCSLRSFPEDSSIVVISPDGMSEKTPDFYFNLSKEINFSYSELENFLNDFKTDQFNTRFHSIAASTNKNLIATTHDGALRLWRKENGKYIGTIGGNLKSKFLECNFSKDGANLIGKLESGHKLIYITEKISTTD